MEVWILARHLLGLLPHKACLALERLPVELDKLGGALISHKTVGMDTESINVSEGTRNAVPSHGPEQGVKATRLLAEVIPG